MARTSWTPGVSLGTMTIDCCWCLVAEVSLLPMTRWTLLRGSPAPEIHHLWPLMTISLPSMRIEVWMLVALRT